MLVSIHNLHKINWLDSNNGLLGRWRLCDADIKQMSSTGSRAKAQK